MQLVVRGIYNPIDKPVYLLLNYLIHLTHFTQAKIMQGHTSVTTLVRNPPNLPPGNASLRSPTFRWNLWVSFEGIFRLRALDFKNVRSVRSSVMHSQSQPDDNCSYQMPTGKKACSYHYHSHHNSQSIAMYHIPRLSKRTT